MKKRRNRFNPKRRLQPMNADTVNHCDSLLSKISYGGNSQHKKNPGDFKLDPPAAPRPGKSLCDTVKIFQRRVALNYLREGLKKAMISERKNGIWPQNIWAVTDDGKPLEAQLENPTEGVYHGYPMPESDPFACEILKEWARRIR